MQNTSFPNIMKSETWRRQRRDLAALAPDHRLHPVVVPARGRCLAARSRGEGSGKLYTARSRLYRNEILQENMRLKALGEIYTMHSFALL